LQTRRPRFNWAFTRKRYCRRGIISTALATVAPAYIFPVLAQKSWDKWTLYGNLGYWWQTAPGKRDYWYSGAVLERELGEQLSLGAELFGNTPTERGGRADVAFQRRWHLEID
jgi:hypothetical protein